MTKLLLRAALGSALLVVIVSIALSMPMEDFIEYWSAAHLLVHGENCYSLARMFQLQRDLNWPQPVPLMCLAPPWFLPLLLPLGLLHSYPIAWALWTLAMTAALALSSFLLMDLYAPEVRLREVSDTPLLRALFIFSFFPVILSVRFAQIAGLMLLGIVAFLWLERKGYLFLAGSALMLAAFKPQFLYLIFLAVMVVSWWQRCLRMVAGFAAAASLFTAIAWAIDPSVVRGYLFLATTPYVQLYPSALGEILRVPFRSANTFYLQFLPCLFGISWLFFFLRRHRNEWNWLDAMPCLIAASVLTTSYGWLFDQAVLAVPIVALFASSVRSSGRIPTRLFWLYSGLNLAFILFSLPIQTFASITRPLLYASTPCVLLVLLSSAAVLQKGTGQSVVVRN